MRSDVTDGTGRLEVWFLPWVGLRRAVILGQVYIWPFSGAEPRKRILDVPTRKHLRRYFRSYVDHEGRAAKTIAICSHGPRGLRLLCDDERWNIRAAVDALAFSCICPATIAAVNVRNNSVGPPSAELFQLVGTTVVPGDDNLAVSAGSGLHGGWMLGEISFAMPWSTGGGIAIPNQRVVEALSKLLLCDPGGSARERIMRSLEWFRFAHIDSEEVSCLSRIVMMATAFEILLEVPSCADKSDWIANEVAGRCATDDSIFDTAYEGRRGPTARPGVARWAYGFYKIRNEIVHGDEVPFLRLSYPCTRVPWMTQQIAADLLYWELVTRELFRLDCFGEEFSRQAAELRAVMPDDPEPRLELSLFEHAMGYGAIHRSLGWRADFQAP